MAIEGVVDGLTFSRGLIKYPYVIELANGAVDYVVIFPDLKGVTQRGQQRLWVEEEIRDGRRIPTPSASKKGLANEDWILGFVGINVPKKAK